MKVIAVLLLAHVIVCGSVGYVFRERTAARRDFNPPITEKAPDRVDREEFTLLLSQTDRTTTYPGPVVIYGLFGIAALLVSLLVTLFSRFGRR